MNETGNRGTRHDPAVRFIIVLGALVLAIGLVSLFFEILGTWLYVSVFLTILMALGLFWGNRLYEGGRGRSPILGGVVILCACLLFFLDVVSANRMFGGPLHAFSWVLFIVTAGYFVLAYLMGAGLVLAVAILALLAWAAYLGGGFWGWLPFFRGGINSHTYVAVMTPFIILAGFIHERLSGTASGRYSRFSRVYYFLGFLFLNISLWMLSLFGRDARLFGGSSGRAEIIVFTVLFFVANSMTIVFGGVKKERSFITLGVIFLTVNVLTRFGDVIVPGLGRSATFIIAGAMVITIGLLLEGLLKKKRG